MNERKDEGVEFNVLKAAAGENPWSRRSAVKPLCDCAGGECENYEYRSEASDIRCRAMEALRNATDPI